MTYSIIEDSQVDEQTFDTGTLISIIEVGKNETDQDNKFKTFQRGFSTINYDSRKDSVVENYVYPSLRPKTRTQMSSSVPRQMGTPSQIDKKMSKCSMPPKTHKMYYENPRFMSNRKSELATRSSLKSVNMYHLDNVIGQSSDRKNSSTCRKEGGFNGMYSTFDNSKRTRNGSLMSTSKSQYLELSKMSKKEELHLIFMSIAQVLIKKSK